MNKEVIDILKSKAIFLVLIFVIIAGGIFWLGITDGAVIPATIKNYQTEADLKQEIKDKTKTLEQIENDNKLKSEAAKKATVKEFFTTQGTGDITNDLAPMFENVITMIKQNGLRMKSINYKVSPQEDNLVKNGGGAYNGCKVDFELVGYYPQFTALLQELEMYPYFINISKFEVKPYQYDKRILITNMSIVFYSKR